MRQRRLQACLRTCAIALSIAAIHPALALAGLSADQLALVYNGNSPVSHQLAINYAQARGVPDDRLIGLDLPLTEDISRAEYLSRCVDPLRAELQARGLNDRVRCLVTFYDVPLRIKAIRPTKEQSAVARRLDGEFGAAVDELLDVCAELDRLAADASTAPPAAHSTRPVTDLDDLAELLRHYARCQQAALARLGEQAPASQPGLRRAFLQIVERTEGMVGLTQGLRAGGKGTDPRANQRLAQMHEVSKQMQAQLAALLDHPPESDEREQARKLTPSALGLVGLVSRLDHDRRQLRGEETVAALDSELTLLWYESFPAYLWITNPDNPRSHESAGTHGPVEAPRPGDGPILMVSRLDGATPPIVQRLFEHAVSVEKTGLRGNVYIDASAAQTRPGYAEYNANLLNLAALLKQKTSLHVVLDERKELFGPGECPNTALYCGWYSHRKYVPAFEFVPGSVGFHIASSEAISLRKPTVQYWCKRMLEEGVAATIGPVREPYLSAFPLPTDFFGLLLTGQYSLAECYHLTTPFLSWMMILVGDPLYRPFANNPMLTPEDVYAPGLLPFLRPAAPTQKPAREQAQ